MLFISKVCWENSYWWLVDLVLIWFVNSIYFSKYAVGNEHPVSWKWRGRFILSFIPPKGKVLFQLNTGFFWYIVISLAVDESWIVSIYSKFLGLFLPSLGHFLDHFIFNIHPVRAGQRMEHLTSHELFPSTLCTSH